MKQKVPTQGMVVFGLHYEADKGNVYRVKCDRCQSKFDVPSTFGFAKCDCGAFQRLSEVVSKLREDAAN